MALTRMGEIRQYHSMADSAPITMIRGRIEKARLIMLPGLVTANGAGPPPMKPNTKLVPALVAVVIAVTTPFSASSASRAPGAFNSNSAMAACSSKVPATIRQLNALRASETAQAKAMMATMPNADCRCGNIPAPAKKYPITLHDSAATSHDRRPRRG